MKSYLVINDKGNEEFIDLNLQLSNYYIYFPYMDSFNYYERETNTIYFSKMYEDNLCDTEGNENH